MRRRKLMRTAFSLPADRTAKSYVASGAGLGRGLGTVGYGGLTRKDPPEIETAAGRATAGRVVPIAIPNTRDGLLSSMVGPKANYFSRKTIRIISPISVLGGLSSLFVQSNENGRTSVLTGRNSSEAKHVTMPLITQVVKVASDAIFFAGK
ncbi:hypothetical protein YC2023_036346 [Brassica napus]